MLLKSALAATVAVLAIVWLFAQQRGRAGATAFLGPFLHAWQKIDDAASGAAAAVLPWKRSPAAKTRDLEAQVRLAEIKLAETDTLRREYAELRQLAQLPPIPEWKVVIADVIARDPVTWNRGFRIGRGQAHGVRTGCAVLAGPFVIGRITECGELSSTVTTVASQACRIGVVLARGQETGVLRGLGAQQWRSKPDCIVDFLPKETVATPGDTVWTSGLGGTVPGGLVVGKVIAAPDGQAVEVIDGAHARVSVVPSADFGRLHLVAVVCPTSDTE
jgi:rod shape-determining protein MreC